MGDTTYYKVSYVVEDGSHPGAILNTKKEPQVGDVVNFGGRAYEITEVMELIPPKGDFGFLHVTCRPTGRVA